MSHCFSCSQQTLTLTFTLANILIAQLTSNNQNCRVRTAPSVKSPCIRYAAIIECSEVLHSVTRRGKSWYAGVSVASPVAEESANWICRYARTGPRSGWGATGALEIAWLLEASDEDMVWYAVVCYGMVCYGMELCAIWYGMMWLLEAEEDAINRAVYGLRGYGRLMICQQHLISASTQAAEWSAFFPGKRYQHVLVERKILQKKYS